MQNKRGAILPDKGVRAFQVEPDVCGSVAPFLCKAFCICLCLFQVMQLCLWRLGGRRVAVENTTAASGERTARLLELVPS